MLGVDTVEHIQTLCEGGNLNNIDLRIKDMSSDGGYQINGDLTASNFGKLSDMATNEDLALGIANMVAETIAMLAVFAARSYNINTVVLTGNLTTINAVNRVFKDLNQHFGIKFITPEFSQFATVIGAALSDIEK